MLEEQNTVKLKEVANSTQIFFAEAIALLS